MLYRILQFLMRQSLRVHYDKIIVEGDKGIKSDIPLLVASTHPNSFLDAVILGSVIDRPLFFLARSDVFNKKWSDYILRKMNLIPIYRLQEGATNLNKNDETFKSCFEILEKKGAVLIFAEGISLIDKKVRPPKKGLARIGFGAESRNSFNLDTEILPVGINYESAAKLRNRILVQFEKPIPLKRYEKEYFKNANSSYQDLNEKLFSELKAASILSNDEHIYDFIAKKFSNGKYNFKNLKALSEQIQKLKESDTTKYTELLEKTNQLIDIEKRFEFNSKFLTVKANQLPLLIFLFPLACVGLIINYPPIIIARFLSNKKVKLIEFYASVKIVLGTILWLFWGLLIFTIFLILGKGIFIGLFVIGLMLLLGKAYMHFKFAREVFICHKNFKRLKTNSDFTRYQEATQFIENLFPNSI